MTKAIGYTRLSQVSDTSIERQKRHIRQYAEEHGFDLTRIYDDGERSSGFDDDRAAYQQVRDRIVEGDIDAVIVNDKRRLARDIDEVMRLIPDLRTEGVELHTKQDGQLDLEDPMRAAIEILQAAAAYQEKMEEIRKAIEATQERVKDPGVDHGRPRFGMTYNADGTKQVPGEDFDKVLEVLRARSRGDTYQEIEDELGVSTTVAHRIVQRREWYVERSQLAEQ